MFGSRDKQNGGLEQRRVNSLGIHKGLNLYIPLRNIQRAISGAKGDDLGSLI
jgi:hypothetical protein